MFESVKLLFESRGDFDWEPLIRGFVKKDRRATRELLNRLRPLMAGLAAGYKGDDPVADDWVNDFISQRLPRIAQAALKNIDKGKYNSSQFPAFVTASLRNFLNNKVRDSKLRKKREREAGQYRGVQTDDPNAGNVAQQDKEFVAKVVKKYIAQEKNADARKFLMHLMGLDKSKTLTMSQLTGGGVNQALASAGLDPKAWQDSGRASKARARLFDRLRRDKSFRKFAGVESETIYGPTLAEFVTVIHPHTKPLIEELNEYERFYRWVLEAMHG